MATEARRAVVAATEQRGRALAALTGAALGLPGTSPMAFQFATEATGNIQFAHYQESDDRIEARVYHADALFPLSSETNIRISADQDIYSGATPLFSVPRTMTGLPKRPLGSTSYSPADVVASASPVVGTFEVTTSMHGFRAFEDAVAAYLAATPPAMQTVQDGLTAGYTGVVNRLVPGADDIEQRLATQPREARNELQIGLVHDFGGLAIDLSGGVSREPDFESDFAAASLSWETNDRHTTLQLGYSISQNEISRAAAHGSDGTHVHAGDQDYPALDETSTFHGLSLNLTQVVSKHTLAQFNASFTRQDGYLSNPYKLVYIRGEITPQEYAALNLQHAVFQDVTDLQVAGVELFHEVRPDRRDQWAFSGLLRHHLPAQDATVHVDYRYYRDSWGIDAHTLEGQWHQQLGDGLVLTPSLRYYTQSGAEFYAPYFLAPRADGYYSSDYRLSGYGALSAGLNVRKQISPGIAVQAGVEYYTHKGSLRLGGNGSGDFADYHSYLFNASLEIDLEGRGSVGIDNGHARHRHRHHGASPPAGVLFGHMLDRAGDVMFAYSYVQGGAEGAMRHGSGSVADAVVVANACGASGCSNTPARMSMDMHMLHLMYAPTDWLTLSVMPMLVNKDMRMRPLQGVPASNLHDHPHGADGIGDTRVAALLKLFDGVDHDVHLGMALSAPTGSLDATLDGTGASTSELQGYGMQLGSGTWDLIPSLTYTGRDGAWSWGGQLSGTMRLESGNSQGYRLGDELQATAWLAYRLLPWLGTSLRGSFTHQGTIRGEVRRANSRATPVDFTDNYGGEFWDLGIGLQLNVPNGRFSGHGLSLEWLQPVHHNYNGYQLEREGRLHAAWSYHF